MGALQKLGAAVEASPKLTALNKVQSSFQLLPLQGKTSNRRSADKKKVIKLVGLLHLNGTIPDKEKEDIIQTSPYFMSELTVQIKKMN